MDLSELHELGDLLVERPLSNNEVRGGLSVALQVATADVFVCNDLAEVLGQENTWRVLCQVTVFAGGDFRTLLSSQGEPVQNTERIPVAARLAHAFRCRCLVEDGSINPFSWLLVDGKGACEPVSLDPVRVDDEYVLMPAPDGRRAQ